MVRIFNICMGLAVLGCIGCQINENDPSRKDIGVIQGTIEDGEVSGSGVVFLQIDSTYRFRGLLGAPEDHISIDIELENLNPGVFQLKPESKGISVVRVIGRDAVGTEYRLNPSGQNTLVLKEKAKAGSISGTLTLNVLNEEEEEEDLLKAALSFTIPVAPGLKNAWDCDFTGENVKGCRFIE